MGAKNAFLSRMWNTPFRCVTSSGGVHAPCKASVFTGSYRVHVLLQPLRLKDMQAQQQQAAAAAAHTQTHASSTPTHSSSSNKDIDSQSNTGTASLSPVSDATGDALSPRHTHTANNNISSPR